MFSHADFAHPICVRHVHAGAIIQLEMRVFQDTSVRRKGDFLAVNHVTLFQGKQWDSVRHERSATLQRENLTTVFIILRF